MIYIIITSYGELDSTIKAIESFLKQKIKQEYKIIVVDPFQETRKAIEQKFKKNKNIEFFLDPGEGKNYALNILLERIYSKNTDDIIISTDGDVYVNKNSVKALIKAFKDKKVGCVSGRPISLESKKTMFGYWSHLLFEGGHRVRDQLSKTGKFLECSGYLFAFRNGLLQGFSLKSAEDSIIPFTIWKKGYKIKYTPEAEVYTHNPKNWKDWVNQKKRNIIAHESQEEIAEDMPRTKSFFNEIKEGTLFALFYPKNLKEFFWTFLLFLARLYVYIKSFYEIKFKKKTHRDGWRAKNYFES